jgi:hypothetical protein
MMFIYGFLFDGMSRLGDD